jgi:hypothetical protein
MARTVILAEASRSQKSENLNGSAFGVGHREGAVDNPERLGEGESSGSTASSTRPSSLPKGSRVRTLEQRAPETPSSNTPAGRS